MFDYNFCILVTRHVNVARMSAGEAVVSTLWFLSWSLAASTAPPGSANETSDTASGKLSSGKTRLNCSTRAFLGCKLTERKESLPLRSRRIGPTILFNIKYDGYLGATRVTGRLQIDAQTVLFGFTTAGRSTITSEKSTPSVRTFVFIRLFRFRWGSGNDTRRVVSLVIGPIFRMRIAVRPPRTVVALSVDAALCNTIMSLSTILLTSSLSIINRSLCDITDKRKKVKHF